MDKNNQNKSHNENCLQILLLPVGNLSDRAVLTLTDEKLRQLGIENYTVSGVIFTTDGLPTACGVFDNNEARFIGEQINTILKAAIVNSDQRKAVGTLIEKEILGRQYEMANWTRNQIKEVESSAEKACGDNGLIVRTSLY